jgi:hypothetical protein
MSESLKKSLKKLDKDFVYKWRLEHAACFCLAGFVILGCLFFFVPYFDRPFFLFNTLFKSILPRTAPYLIPGKSRIRRPIIVISLKRLMLCPSPGIKTETTFEFTNLTFAILRNAELGLRGVFVKTAKHVPLLCGL